MQDKRGQGIKMASGQERERETDTERKNEQSPVTSISSQELISQRSLHLPCIPHHLICTVLSPSAETGSGCLFGF